MEWGTPPTAPMLEPLPQDKAWPRIDDVELPADLLLRDWTAPLSMRAGEVLASFYVSQLRLFCTLAQFQHQIVAVLEVREMPSITQERTDKATLAEYDLAPDMTCWWSPHPDHERCGAVARYGFEGRDSVYGQGWLSYACDWHALGLWNAARCGTWCVCTEHKGHVVIDLTMDNWLV